MESKKEVMHTPEPWVIEPDPVYGRHFNITTAKRIEERITCIAQVELHWDESFESEQIANARRIVACVNACKHYTTEDLEDVGENLSGVFADVKARCAELVAQRDELLAALKALLEVNNQADLASLNPVSYEEEIGLLNDECAAIFNAVNAIAKCEVKS